MNRNDLINSKYLKLYMQKGDIHSLKDDAGPTVDQNVSLDKTVMKHNPYFIKNHKKVPDITLTEQDLKKF